MTLEGTNALVTGGSRGLGAALGAALARRGARVALVARGEPALSRVVKGIREEGGQAHALIANVGDKEAIHRIVGAASALVGPIDLLVNGAATLGPLPMPVLMETPCEALETVLQKNLLGPFRLAKAVLGSMALRGRGLVLNITSDAAILPYPGWGAYGVSKAALEHLTRIWAAELAGTGVRILSVDPGEMDTRMHADAVPEADRSALPPADEAARAIVALIERVESVTSGERVDLSGAVAAAMTERAARRVGA